MVEAAKPPPRHAFSELQIGRMLVRGRVFKSATSETRATVDGKVSDLLLHFYEPIFAAGTPLVVTGAMYVHASGKAAGFQLAADDDTCIAGMTRLTELARRYDVRIIAQLNHAGRQLVPHTLGLNEALSASSVYDWSLGTKPRELSASEIDGIVESFAAAAVRCQQAGFDGVQLQAAHGYLISQFLTPHTNRRSDDFAAKREGSPFLFAVYDAVRAAVRPDFPILLKLNGEDALLLGAERPTADLVEVAYAMQERGVDAIEVSVGHYVSLMPGFRGHFNAYLHDFLREGLGAKLPWLQRSAMTLSRPLMSAFMNWCWPAQEGFNAHLAAQFKQRLAIPVICVGGFHSLDAINNAIANGSCDAVSIGRAMIADPSLYRHLRIGTSGPKCNYCNRCLARAGTQPIDCYNDAVRPRSLRNPAFQRSPVQ
jgi:2,4-dienoyl-CoA reductase-like NADH-dependent reductase (Old Yellow Enzyme family)